MSKNKYAREIKVAILVVICAFLLFFGLNYLKGINIFTSSSYYVGVFDNVSGLKEQAPVYIRGYKVGQVEKISYDFTQQRAFAVTISVERNIQITDPTSMRLFDDGMLGGKAIEVVLPVGEVGNKHVYASGDTLPAMVVPGLLETLQEGFMAKLDDAIQNIDLLIVKVNNQIDSETLKQTLDNLESVSENLSASAHDIKEVTHNQLPDIIMNADTMVSDAKEIVSDIKQANIPATLARVDNTIDTVQSILTTKQGTLGMLLNDSNLYCHVDSTVVSLDSLLSDLKANPKRYVHFSLFGNKNKEKKKTKE